MDRFNKDPDAVLDYVVDWTSWLAGDTISSAQVVTYDAGITVESDSVDGDLHTIWLSGGTVGTGYTITSRITTGLGRTQDHSILIICKEN